VVVQAGHAGEASISIDASTPVTNVSFTLDVTPAALTNFSLPTPAPPLAQATLQQLSPGRLQLHFQTLAGQSLVGQQTVSSLQFVAAAAAPSAFGTLHVSGLTATATNGSNVARTLTQDGQVTLVSIQPLLTVGLNGAQLQVTIYAEAGPYTVWSTPSLTPPITWSPIWTGQVSNLFEVIPVPISQKATFYRASSP
jgi:hypothetical protein